MFLRVLGVGLLSVVLSGCNQIMGGMPEKMDNMRGDLALTNATMDKLYSAMSFANVMLETSVENLSEMERLQTLGGSIEMVRDRSGLLQDFVVKRGMAGAEEMAKLSNLNFRVRMAQVMIAVADVGLDKPFKPGQEVEHKHREDQLYENLGALGPLKFPSLPLVVDGAAQAPDARNVTIVSLDPDKDASELNVPIDYELHNVYKLAVQRMVRKLLAAVSDNNYDKKILRERSLNLFYAATAILGAARSPGDAVFGAVVPQPADRFIVPAEEEVYSYDDGKRETITTRPREAMAKNLIQLHNSLNMKDDILLSTVKMLIETRLEGKR